MGQAPFGRSWSGWEYVNRMGHLFLIAFDHTTKWGGEKLQVWLIIKGEGAVRRGEYNNALAPPHRDSNPVIVLLGKS